MTKREGKSEAIDLKALLTGDEDYLRAMVEAIVQATLEAEMTEALGAAKGERSAGRLGPVNSQQIRENGRKSGF